MRDVFAFIDDVGLFFLSMLKLVSCILSRSYFYSYFSSIL